MPHTELASYKSDQNWVTVSENKQKLIFPGGGTQFKTEGRALHYIEYIEKVITCALDVSREPYIQAHIVFCRIQNNASNTLASTLHL